MADYGLSTLGIRFFGAESLDGKKVTDASAYTEFTRINSIGEVAVEANNIDASAMVDSETKYVMGRSDVSDTFAVTINLTNETYYEWKAVAGKKMCFATYTPGLTPMEFVIATVPHKIPSPPKDQNSLLTVTINCTTNDFIGFDTAVEGLVDDNEVTITLDKTTDSVDVGDTTTLTATTVPAGAAVTWTSNDTSIATVANGVVTGVSAGTAVITAKSGTATASCTVTVS